jgi:hypothetical protein
LGATAKISKFLNTNTLAAWNSSMNVRYPEARAGNRKHFDWAIQKVYTYLKQLDSALVSIDPRLVTASGAPCPDNWRSKDDTQCVIEIGDRDDDPITRGFKTAKAVCAVTGGCALLPQGSIVAASAIGLGYLKESGMKSVGQYCRKD